MNYEKINALLQEHFDEMNSVGLGELFLFTDSIRQFVENDARRERLLKVVVDICGGYNVNARTFVNLISYEDFKKRRGISEITALGLRLYLLYQCGVDWVKPHVTIKGV